MATTQTLTKLPNIQYAGMDFTNVVSEIQTIIENNPTWSSEWTSFYRSDAGVLLTDLMAWIMDNLSLKQDLVYNEMFLDTANKDSSIIRLLRQINYTPSLASSSKVPITFEFQENRNSDTFTIMKEYSSFSSRVSEIIGFNSDDTSGTSTHYEILPLDSDGYPDYLSSLILSGNSTVFTTDSKGNTLYALQGTTSYESFSSSTDDGPTFTLNSSSDTDIAANSIKIYDKNGSELQLVSSFISKEAKDEDLAIPYVIEMNTDQKIVIRFASEAIMTYDDEIKSSRLFSPGETINVFYRTTNGSKGNISYGTIDTTVTLNSYSINICNDSNAEGGKDKETLAEASINGPLSLKHMDRAVTPDDYDYILDSYTDVKLSKTYTSYNSPTNFKTGYYGRYLNPQEALSFVLLNKTYSDVPASEYNNFSWMTMNKEPIINEKYIFGSAEFNGDVSLSNTYNDYTVVTQDGNKTYTNATILTLPSDFTSKAVEESENLDDSSYDFKLNLKLSTETGEYNYFSKILFSFIEEASSDNYSEDTAKSDVITTKSPIVSKNVHARYTSSNYIEKGTPIDCYNYDYIKFNLDNKNVITINLKQELDSTDGLTNYYLYLSNPDPDDEVATYSKNSKKYASFRKGIVELINDQIVEMVDDDSEYIAYKNTKSFQYFGLEKSNLSDVVIGSLSNDIMLGATINGVKYCFTLNSNIKSVAASYFNNVGYYYYFPSTLKANGAKTYYPITYNAEGFPEYTGTEKGVILDEDTNLYTSTENKPIYAERELYNNDLNSSTTTLTLKELVSYLEYCIITNNGVDIIEDNSVRELTSSEIYVLNNYKFTYKNSSELISDYAYDLVLENINSYGLYSKTDDNGNKYIRIENISDSSTSITVGSYTIYSFAHYVLGKITDYTSYDYSDILPDVQVAVSYDSVASVVNETTTSGIVGQRLRIQSPLLGESSSIYIQKSNTSSSTYDFMYSVLGITYSNYGYSNKSYGIRKVEMLTDNGISASYIPNGSTESVTSYEIPFTGNIIFESNDITSVYYSIYANYKISDSSKLEIGSVRNNWYSPSEEDPPEIHGIEGEYVYEDEDGFYEIDKSKSDYDIRFTSEKQDTNSLYNITSDIDVIPCSIANVVTGPMSVESNSEEIPLSIKLDEMTTYFNIPVGDTGSLTSTILYNYIDSYFSNSENSDTIESAENGSEVDIESADSFVRKEYNSPSQLVFSNFLKNSSGNISFHYPTVNEDGISIEDPSQISDNVKNFYKHLLGTNSTNSELYSLYPKKLFETDDETTKVFYVDGSTTEYYYAPIYTGKDETTVSVTIYSSDGVVFYSDSDMTVAYIVKGEIAHISNYEYTDTYTVEVDKSDGDLKFEYRKMNDSGVSVSYDYYIDAVGDNTSNYNFYIYKTDNSSFPDCEFYMHFIQDRTYETDSDGNIVKTDEYYLQNYMNKHKISSTDIIFSKPYFKTFDISATIIYNDNYTYSDVKERVENAIEDEYNIENYSIGNSILKSSIYKIITNIDGVEGVNIDYFGYDYSDQDNYPSQEHILTSDFFEILALNSQSDTTGMIFTYEDSTTYFGS